MDGAGLSIIPKVRRKEKTGAGELRGNVGFELTHWFPMAMLDALSHSSGIQQGVGAPITFTSVNYFF